MQQPISYRDRAGFVLVEEGVVKRYVSFFYAETYDCLVNSGLYRKLVQEDLLIPHAEKVGDSAYYRILEPEIIPFISLPYEWTATQWKQVLLCFLRINRISLQYGMILKDATPFNFAFYKGKPVFFDTLSFARYNEGDPWIAYHQFCTSMLGPLALMYGKGIAWGRMLQSHINGWPLWFLSRSLPWRSWCNPLLLLHIHLHARTGSGKKDKVTGKGLSGEKLQLLWQMMESSLRKWKKPAARAVWSDYYDNGILSEKYLQSKTGIVTKWLADTRPGSVVDLGANNGMFSFIAAAYAGKVIAVESDHDCVEGMRAIIEEKKYTLVETVLADIVQPTPATGWRNEERPALLQRLKGEMLLALAVIHHLCIASNVPLALIARLFADITEKYLVVEFVPRTDPKVEAMLLNREDIFTDYTEEVFLDQFRLYFNLLEVADCSSSGRKLFLWSKK